ncbi:hypothetical protein [Clostridium gasigenes]|uniref:Uncharacterized protein n=1 Tax=Clostridium gasigenes TaxID=94869 RepID=A0A1H0S1K1_9CLOT|nr:hypothetical protein [Clostridium gasigenes]SDP35600.1 hypothetical protein SAMN04488529_104117 [Clostridium gasigenes]
MDSLEIKEEQLLAYLYSQLESSSIRKISRDVNGSIATLYKYIKILIKDGYIIQMSEGRVVKYRISDEGKSYVEKNAIVYEQQEELEKNKRVNEPLYKAEEILDEIGVMKKNIEKQKDDFDNKILKYEKDMDKLKEGIEKVKEMTENFYGKIGEIITLLIASISIIVFNIKVMESTKIDFTKGYKEAFLNIMAIDLPLIVLLVVATVLFHYIIGKELKLRRLISVIVIIIACMFILLI